MNNIFKSLIPKADSHKVSETTMGKTIDILIPKEDMQEVTVLESWTVSWKIKTGWSDATEKYYKCFINEEEAQEFKKQLDECAKFINAWIRTDINKN